MSPMQHLFKCSDYASELADWLDNGTSADTSKRVKDVLKRIQDELKQKKQTSRPVSASRLSKRDNGEVREQKKPGAKSRPCSAPPSSAARRGSECFRHHTGISDGTERLAIGATSITTNHMFYGMGDAYPEIYRMAVEAGRAHPLPNYTHKSAWGDSLRKGSNKTHKPFLKTTYQKFNEEVFNKETKTSKAKSEGFANWAKRNQLYYGDLFKGDAAECIDQLLEKGSHEERRELVNLFRGLHAVIRPDKHKSTSHAHHCGFKSLADSKVTRAPVIKAWESSSRVATKPNGQGRSGPNLGDKKTERLEAKHGHSRKQCPEERGPVAETVEGESGDADMAESQRTRTRTTTTTSYGTQPEITTFKSQVPVDWIGHIDPPLTTSYRDTFTRDQSEEFNNTAAKPRLLTMAFGGTLPHQDVCRRRAFPVRVGFARQAANPGEPKRNLPVTTTRSAFLPRSRMDTLRSAETAARAIGESRAARGHSTIPLGKMGITIPSDWRTVYMAEYKKHKYDARGNFLANQSMRKAVSRPTGPVGALAPNTKKAVLSR